MRRSNPRMWQGDCFVTPLRSVSRNDRGGLSSYVLKISFPVRCRPAPPVFSASSGLDQRHHRYRIAGRFGRSVLASMEVC